MTAFADDTPPHRSRPLRTTLEWAAIIVAALLAALAVKAWLFQPFYIPSESMEPTLLVNDRILVAKRSTHPGRRDIVVFKRPPGVEEGKLNKDLIKRVIALPNETVEGRDNQVFVNGKPLDEPYLSEGAVTTAFPPTTVGPGQYWVMGDNRSNSKDSRAFGVIQQDTIVGRAVVLFWPPGDLSWL